MLSLLALLGAVVCVVRIRRGALEPSTGAESPSAAYAFALFGALLWLLMFCGRPTWGVLFTMLGAGNVHLHRLIGGLHTFGFFLMGIGLGSVWFWCVNKRFRGRYVLATLIGVAVLFPVFRERRIYLQKNAEWSQSNLAALSSQEEHIDAAVSSLKTGSGRTYSGLAATWGNQFRVGSVPFHGILSVHHIPALSFLYHAMAQTSDLMVWFDELNPAHYRLFNVSAVVAPSTQSVPPFLHERSSTGDFRLYGAPANGYFDVVRVPYAVSVFADDVYDVNLAWLKSDWPSRLNHLLLDADGRTGAGLPRLLDTQSLPEAGGAFDLGFVSDEKRDGEIYEVAAELQQSGYLLFKMTYHPAWRAIVDGSPQSPVMLTPRFMGVALGPGRHLVRFQYQPGPLKALLIILALLIVFGAAVAERHGGLDWIDFAINRAGRSIRETLDRGRLAWMPAGFGLLALSLPVCIPLLTSRLVSGHDAFSYAPRLVEFHENIHNGVLLPRWAPDLGNGGGQPLFLFNPPLIYYLAEIWYLLGCQTTTAYNLACVVIIVASAVFMRLLGQLYFGRAGGWLAAVAYIYSPYFHVDLYVRQALAEFAAFPFYPLTLYGFGRFARDRDRRFLLLGAIGLACVFLAHNAAALLFAPILSAFILYNAWSGRSLKLMLQLFGGAVLGLALSAFVWLPILMEMKDVHIDRFIEGYLNYSNHMVYVQQFFSTTWGFGLSWPGYGDGMSFSLGWPHVLMLVAAVAIWRKQQSERRGPVYLFTLLAAAYCFLMTPAALWLWERVSILQPVEFPWRMLGPVAVCVAMVVASLGNRMTRGTG